MFFDEKKYFDVFWNNILKIDIFENVFVVVDILGFMFYVCG